MEDHILGPRPPSKINLTSISYQKDVLRTRILSIMGNKVSKRE